MLQIPESTKINPINTHVANNTFNIYEWEIKNITNLIVNELNQNKSHQPDESNEIKIIIERNRFLYNSLNTRKKLNYTSTRKANQKSLKFIQ